MCHFVARLSRMVRGVRPSSKEHRYTPSLSRCIPESVCILPAAEPWKFDQFDIAEGAPPGIGFSAMNRAHFTAMSLLALGAVLVALLAAHVGFIGLDGAVRTTTKQFRVRLSQAFADAMANEPCGLFAKPEHTPDL